MTEIFRQERTEAALTERADERITRLHLIYLARLWSRGCDVLDLRAGDGSGAAVIAQVARSVRALVADPATRDVAAASFAAPGLHFGLSTDWRLIQPKTLDLILVFGMIDLVADQEGTLADIRAMLRPGGRVLIATTDRDSRNTSLTAAHPARYPLNGPELLDLVGRCWPHARLFGQRGLIGSAILGTRAAVPMLFEHCGRLQVQASPEAHRAPLLLCVGSDAPVDDVPDSLFIDDDLSAFADTRRRALEAEIALAALKTDHAALMAVAESRLQSDAAWRHELAVLRVSAAAAQSARDQVQARFDAAEQRHLHAAARFERAEAEARSLADQIASLRAGRARTPLLRARAALTGLHPSLLRRVRILRGSSKFDPGWYRGRYPDVDAAGADPARHYLTHGAAEERDPGPAFDAAWYVAQHPDCDPAALSPVEHYERHGRAADWPTCPVSTASTPLENPRDNPRVLFVSGEADTPGSDYRCVRPAAAARAAGFTAECTALEHTGARELIGVEIVVLWRVRYSPHVAGIMREVRAHGGTVVFDIDDLMIRPELARTSIIDGIRTTNAGISSTRVTFTQVQEAMAHADLCTTTTEEIARHMREWQKAAYVLPNGFDDATHARARRAVRARVGAPGDQAIRIGYAAGTLTHQKDFLVALPGLLRVMAARPSVRLVLFRAANGTDLVVIDEFDELVPFADRIEWRDHVQLEQLPDELARFDINIAPLELNNPFCEAKSELKYFEAALVNVPTVASPTGPFARAIAHGRTGMLAADDEAWYDSLMRLVDNVALRHDIGRRAYVDCLWRFGPQRRAELMRSFLEQITGTAHGARAFALETLSERDSAANRGRARDLVFTPTDLIFQADRLQSAAVSVIVPCYNYADTIIEALESVRLQTIDPIDLIIVDDCSSDPLTGDLIAEWARRHADRFNRLLVLRHRLNAGLSAARNTGFEAAETPFVLPLDADNRLRPTCCAALLAAIEGGDAAYAYPSIKMFEADDSVFCNERYQPIRFVGGNYIDAMALVAKWAWAAAGGYDMPRDMGWEDFDLWCTLAEQAQRGIHVNEILADYRVHTGSMLAASVEVEEVKQRTVALIERRHSWLRLSSRTPHQRV